MNSHFCCSCFNKAVTSCLLTKLSLITEHTCESDTFNIQHTWLAGSVWHTSTCAEIGSSSLNTNWLRFRYTVYERCIIMYTLNPIYIRADRSVYMPSNANYDTAVHDVKYVISKQNAAIIFMQQCECMKLPERVSIYASKPAANYEATVLW